MIIIFISLEHMFDWNIELKKWNNTIKNTLIIKHILIYKWHKNNNNSSIIINV